MRTTDIRLSTHLGMQFKAHWLIMRKVKVIKQPAEEILAAKGIEVIEPNLLLRPALIEEPYEMEVCPQETPVEKPPCYIFTNYFQPLQFLHQAQLLTNSLAFESLPEKVIEKVTAPNEEDNRVIKDALIHAHLLDAQQDKLPYNKDYKKFPGYIPPRSYGIKNFRKINNLMYPLFLRLNQEQKLEDSKNVLEDVMSRVTLNHSEQLIHMKHFTRQLVCSKIPMEPVFGPKDVDALRGAPMPDIYPFSPFVHCRPTNQYDLVDGFGVPGAHYAPHTVVAQFTGLKILQEPRQFYGISLLHAFSHAASYARELHKDVTGDLDKPVTLNVVHTNGQYIQVGRFQLNTLDLNGSTRNLYWYTPWEKLFENIEFLNAKPVVEGLNANPLTLLRALY